MQTEACKTSTWLREKAKKGIDELSHNILKAARVCGVRSAAHLANSARHAPGRAGTAVHTGSDRSPRLFVEE